jgi:hypothetical protein
VYQAGVLRPTIAASHRWCDECCDYHEINYLDFPTGRKAIVACNAGVSGLTAGQTGQLALDTALMLTWLFAESRISVEVVIPNQLWKIGRRTVAGRSRELFFTRGSQTREGSVVAELSRHTKAIAFTPSRGSTGQLQNSVVGLVVALEDVVDLTAAEPNIDWPAIEDSLAGHLSIIEDATKPRKKRGTRTAKIERLRDELKRHLASAADHAIATSEGEGCAELLPRPTKTQLAKLAGMSKYDVTRCFADPTASELRLLWDTADNLESVMRLRGQSAFAK